MGDPNNIKDFFTLWLEKLEAQLKETDRRYEERFIAQEKAISKAEAAQIQYNSVHNDLVRKGESQAKEMITRVDVEQRLAQIRERMDTQHQQVIELQRLYSRGVGGDDALAHKKTQSNWLVGLMITVAIAIIGFVITIGIALYQALKA